MISTGLKELLSLSISPLELRDEQEGQDGEGQDEGSQEDEERADASLDRIGEELDDPQVDESDHEPRGSVDSVGDADVARVGALIGDESDQLVADAPPYEDGGYPHPDEDEHEGVEGRQQRVDVGEDGGQSEANPREGAHPDLVGHDPRWKVADRGRQGVGAQQLSQPGVVRSDGLHQRIVENVLQVGGRVDDRRAHGDEHQEERSLESRQVARAAFAAGYRRHGRPFRH